MALSNRRSKRFKKKFLIEIDFNDVTTTSVTETEDEDWLDPSWKLDPWNVVDERREGDRGVRHRPRRRRPTSTTIPRTQHEALFSSAGARLLKPKATPLPPLPLTDLEGVPSREDIDKLLGPSDGGSRSLRRVHSDESLTSPSVSSCNRDHVRFPRDFRPRRKSVKIDRVSSLKSSCDSPQDKSKSLARRKLVHGTLRLGKLGTSSKKTKGGS